MAAKTTIIAAVLVFVAFVSGVLVGIAGDRLYLMRARHEGRPLPHPSPKFIADRLERRLDLTPQQRKEVEAILNRHGQAIEAISAMTRPRVHTEIQQANAEIERVLTPEQREKFDRVKMRLLPRRQAPGVR